MPNPLADVEADVRCAVAGDRMALDRVLRSIQGDVYKLALRMFWCPHDAADATQEVLMKVITHLSTFRGQSAFKTWVYRITVNHVLNMRRSRVEAENITFDEFSAQLAEGMRSDAPLPVLPEDLLIVEEVKIGCTLAMLICLSREERIAYILGEIFGLGGEDAAFVLDVSAAVYRKRLSRGRERLRLFLSGNCGLVNPDRPCRCERRVEQAIHKGIVNPKRLLFAKGDSPTKLNPQVLTSVTEMESLDAIATIYRSHPGFVPPDRILKGIRELLHCPDSVLFSQDGGINRR